ncbi:MAG TPA: hypothetical protein VKU60_01925 [Chloroflexota bacterium]|nr:hypothetical protein [Chloroflexota bacterium]
MLAAIVLYVTLPERYAIGPVWLIPALEAVLLVGLTISAPRRHPQEAATIRMAAIGLTAIISATNVVDLALLIDSLLHGSKTEGTQLIFAAIQIWLTNVAVFALWFWELDRGGPAQRLRDPADPDFLFPQMNTKGIGPEDWRPNFVDYLYVSFTNAMAFSPTDTLPLTHWAKMLMLGQSLASMLTVAFVAARAVNILS